jgi:hypothetical protein
MRAMSQMRKMKDAPIIGVSDDSVTSIQNQTVDGLTDNIKQIRVMTQEGHGRSS